ncbi:hypothetical protein ACTJJ0_26490 [Chitinophaga sp. 22321]|uniref:Uncharacterized protein n=1 Tax=Chitinophaga hostae TaxID=2831022 RepID=A0ABS5J5M9_9BACT|nr:hypothetical protein [Chitinophaga hostae]MBS0030530.1 hypothetical protein [Chitinophaga hostae]
MNRPFVFLLLFFFCRLTAAAQVWQWSVPVAGARNADATAYLWIPENAKKVRGVVLAQHNMEEISILENPIFRKEMASLSFAIVWVSPSFDPLFRFNEGAGEVLNTFLGALADSSGYGELTYVPVVTIGHSAAASWPYYYAAWNPERTLCAISTSGQWPWFRDPRFAPDIWGKRNINYVPCLETMGEYEAAATWSTEGLRERKEHPYMPLSMLACPGEGHFAASDKKVRYIALYIRKAAQYRLPANYAADQPATLIPIDPVHTGWLMERWKQDELPTISPAPVHRYKGDTTQAFWFFDEELVRATQQYQQVQLHRKPQLTGIQQDGHIIAQQNTHLQVHVPFIPQEDGVSFRLKGVFLDTVPGESERPRKQTGLPAGSALGHADRIPVSIEKITGPFVKINDTIFRFSMRNGLSGTIGQYSLCFAVVHPGDTRYKPFVQQAEMTVPVRNIAGKYQEIFFPAIGNQHFRIRQIILKARSGSGLPVSYYIESGPAYIKGNSIIITPVPPAARYPVKITVVAWQYGRNGAQAVQTAAPVRQSFYLEK